MKKKKLKIFVTGATGFIGKNFIDLYADKYQLLTPNHDKLELLDTNAVDKFFKNNRVDIVLHLANRGGSQKEADYQNPLSINLRIFFNLVKNQDKFKKMIYVGSGAEYAKQYPIVNVKESDFGEQIPEDDFGLYKFIAGKYIEKSDKIINLRAFGVYGKYEDWRFKFISNSICKTLFGKAIVIQNNCLFDYVYVNDFLKIVDYFISHSSKYSTYNVGGGKHLELKDLAEMIVGISGKNIPIVVKNKTPGNEYTCNSRRLTNEIKGFRPTNTKNSLQELYAWYEQNLQQIDRKQLNPPRQDIWKK